MLFCTSALSLLSDMCAILQPGATLTPCGPRCRCLTILPIRNLYLIKFYEQKNNGTHRVRFLPCWLQLTCAFVSRVIVPVALQKFGAAVEG